jgi:hypothetical protein
VVDEAIAVADEANAERLDRFSVEAPPLLGQSFRRRSEIRLEVLECCRKAVVNLVIACMSVFDGFRCIFRGVDERLRMSLLGSPKL